MIATGTDGHTDGYTDEQSDSCLLPCLRKGDTINVLVCGLRMDFPLL